MRTARVIAVTSGKGGVGKTSVAVNLGVALARCGRRAMLVDADLGLANANILLGVDADAGVADLATGERSVEAVVAETASGLMLVPGHSGVGLDGGLDAEARSALASAFLTCAADLDDIIVDTGGGLGAEALGFVAASDLVLVVLTDEPTAFTDAYAVVKTLALRHGCVHFGVVANRVAGPREGRALFDRFEAVAERFLPVHLDYLGAIPEDRFAREAVFARRPLVEAYPSSAAAAAFGRLAERVADAELAALPGGDRFFGLEAVHGAQ